MNTLSVDCVVFGFDEKELKVLLIQRSEEPYKGHWALPGGFVALEESLEEAVQRVLENHTGIKDIYMEQVYVFGEVDRYPERRVVSVAYYALVKKNDYPVVFGSEPADWYPVSGIPPLVFDHAVILQKALNKLKNNVTFHPVGFELLPEKFTLTQLQNLYERILEKTLDKRNFRKKLKGMNLVIELEESEKGVPRRAARYFQFDPEKYRQFLAQGFNFKL